MALLLGSLPTAMAAPGAPTGISPALLLTVALPLATMLVATLNIRQSFMKDRQHTVHTLIKQMRRTKTKALVLTETGYVHPQAAARLRKQYPDFHLEYTAAPSSDNVHPRNQGVAILLHNSVARYLHPTDASTVITPYRTLALRLQPTSQISVWLVGTYSPQEDTTSYTNALLTHINAHAVAEDPLKFYLLLGDINDISSSLDTNNARRPIHPNGVATQLEEDTPF